METETDRFLEGVFIHGEDTGNSMESLWKLAELLDKSLSLQFSVPVEFVKVTIQMSACLCNLINLNT